MKKFATFAGAIVNNKILRPSLPIVPSLHNNKNNNKNGYLPLVNNISKTSPSNTAPIANEEEKRFSFNHLKR